METPNTSLDLLTPYLSKLISNGVVNILTISGQTHYLIQKGNQSQDPKVHRRFVDIIEFIKFLIKIKQLTLKNLEELNEILDQILNTSPSIPHSQEMEPKK